MSPMVLPAATSRMSRRMRVAFETLTVTQRQVVVLYGLDHRPAAAIAQKLGLPADAVRCIFTGACQRMSQVGARAGVTL